MLAVFYCPHGFPHRLKTVEVKSNSREDFKVALLNAGIADTIESVMFIDTVAGNTIVIDQYDW